MPLLRHTASILNNVYNVPPPVLNNTVDRLLRLERYRCGLRRKQLRLSSGDTMVYLEGGNLKGEPLLLIHGFGGNKDNFTRVAKPLAQYHIIIPDLLGFGESSCPPEADYSSVEQVKRIHELLTAKGMANSVHIGGNSMGGLLSVVYASMYPETVQSVWLLDSAGFWSVELADALEGLEMEDNPLLVSNSQDFFDMLQLVMYKPPFLPKWMQAVFAQSRIENRDVERKIADILIDDNIEERAKVIAEHNIPTLVVWGDKDMVLRPETATRIKEIIPQSQVIIMKNIGHVPMVEAVNDTARDYIGFRRGLKRVIN